MSGDARGYYAALGVSLTASQAVIKAAYRRCAATEELKSTLWTSLLGWWGIPWGPVWSIGYGCKNALGGDWEQQVNEALLWQNAVAFATRGQGALAVGLANEVRKSTDAELAQRAADLIRFCSERGVDTTVSLKNVWERSIGRTLLLLAITFAVPAAAAGLMLFSTGSNGVSSASTSAPAFEPSFNDAPLTTTDLSPPEPVSAPIAVCDNPPANGEVLTDSRGALEKGHVLTIENGTKGDAIVKVRDGVTGETLASFFVRSAWRRLPDFWKTGFSWRISRKRDAHY